MTDFNVQQTLSYQGQALRMLDEETIMYSCGNSLLFVSTSSGSQNFLFNKNAGGISAIASNWATRSIAYAPVENNPAIQIYSYPDKRLMATLTEGTDLEYAAIDFSRDGSRVLGIGKLTDYKICVWDVATEKKIEGCDTEMPFGCSFGSFDPSNADRFCTGGENGFIFWEVDRSLDEPALKYALCAVEGGSHESEEESAAHNQFTSHFWTADGSCYCGNTLGEIILFEKGSSTAKVAVKLDDKGVVATSLILTKDCLIVARSDGGLQWLSLENLEVQQTTNLPDGPKGASRISCIVPSPFYEKMAVGTVDGTLHAVALGLEEGEDVTPPELTLLSNYHSGPVLGMCVCTASERSMLATAGIDGTVRLWDMQSYNSLVVKSFGVGSGENAVPDVVTCMDNRGDEPLLAIGSSSGVTRLLVVTSKSKSAEVLEVHSVKLFTGAVSHVLFHQSKQYLAVGSVEDGSVYVLDIRSEGEFDSVCYMESLPKDDTFTAFAWSGNDLVITTDSGTLYALEVPEKSPIGAKNKKIEARVYSQLETALMSDFALHTVTNDLFLVSSSSRSLEQYQVSADGSAEKVLAALQSEEGHHQGILSIGYCPVQRNHLSVVAMLATGGLDGSVTLWTVYNEDGTTKIVKENSVCAHSSAVTKCVFFQDKGTTFVLSADLAGCLHIWTLAGCELILAISSDQKLPISSYASKAYSRPEGGTVHAADEPTYLAKARKIQQEKDEVEYKRVRDKTRTEVNSIRDRLLALLERNEKAPDLEKMQREEFVIDLKAKEEQEKKNSEDARFVREDIQNNDLSVDLVTERIKTECWDSMAVQGCEVHALKSGRILRNFPIRKSNPEEKTLMKKVEMARKIELKAAKDSADPDALKEVPSNTSWLVNCGFLPPTLDPSEKKLIQTQDGSKKSKDDEDEEDETPHEVDLGEKEATLVDLLYHPIMLRTPIQKRRQVTLLKALVQEMKISFNKKFEVLMKAKINAMDKIDSQNERINEIVSELGSEKSFVKPEWTAGEQPDSVLEVTDNEMTKAPYETEAMKRKRKAEEEERRRREAEAAKDDIGGRALMDMMGGTLETKKAVNPLAMELVREEWMDELTFEEMSEEQRAELEQFEAKQKAMIEEKEKQRKALELELKKLTTEISDSSRLFDEKVDDLHEAFLRTAKAVHTQELYLLRLSLSVMQKAADQKKVLTIESRLATFAGAKKDMHARCSSFRSKVDKVKDMFTSMQDADRLMERNFRREMQQKVAATLDQDTLKVLVTLFKKRKLSVKGDQEGEAGPEGNSQSGSFARRTSYRRSSVNAAQKSAVAGRTSFAKASTGKGSKKPGGSTNNDKNNPIAEAMAQALQESAKKTSAFDPYAGVDEAAENKRDSERVEAPGVLDPEHDFPEGFVVDPEVTEQLSQLRIQKINSENQLAVKSRELKVMQEQLVALEAKEQALETQIGDLEKENAGLSERIDLYDTDLEVLVAVKQGQDEIVQDPVTTDYTDAMLVNRDVVEVTNEAIRKLGKEKVAILTKIKNFRKNINFMLWEHKFLEATAKNLDEHYTDLHMLRVTKNLQSFIKDGDTANKQKVEVEKAEAKLEHMKVQHATKMQKLEAKINKLSHQTEERTQENDRLSEQIAQLKANVEMRENIHRSRFESGDGGQEDPAQQAAQRMRTITMRRKLIDLARAQTDEIEFLRQELDRLRQRTFPSFAHSQNRVNRAGNMDEIGLY